MRLVVVLLLLAVWAIPAYAQDSDECERYPTIPVNITPRFDEPVYDYSLNLAQLQTLANDPSRAVHGSHHGLTLGLTRYDPMLEIKVPIKGIQLPDGLACAHVEHVDVTFGYKNVTVYIPHEVPQGSCGFNQVMAHEQKHIAVNKRILDKYAPIIQEKMAAYLKINGTFREQKSDYAIGLLKQKLQAIIDEVGTQMVTENQREQQLIDSPEEYRRVSATCNGQLSQATMQYYRNGR